jgi:hypothetical protein
MPDRESRVIWTVATKYALPVLGMSFTSSHIMEMKTDWRKIMTELWKNS